MVRRSERSPVQRAYPREDPEAARGARRDVHPDRAVRAPEADREREASSHSAQRRELRERQRPVRPAAEQEVSRPEPGAASRPAGAEACRELHLLAVERHSDAAV